MKRLKFFGIFRFVPSSSRANKYHKKKNCFSIRQTNSTLAHGDENKKKCNKKEKEIKAMTKGNKYQMDARSLYIESSLRERINSICDLYLLLPMVMMME